MGQAVVSVKRTGPQCLTPSYVPTLGLLREITVRLLMKLSVPYVTLLISTLWLIVSTVNVLQERIAKLVITQDARPALVLTSS